MPSYYRRSAGKKAGLKVNADVTYHANHNSTVMEALQHIGRNCAECYMRRYKYGIEGASSISIRYRILRRCHTNYDGGHPIRVRSLLEVFSFFAGSSSVKDFDSALDLHLQLDFFVLRSGKLY